MQAGAEINFGIIDITTAKMSKKLVTIPKGQVISTTSSRVLVATDDGVFHIGVASVTTGEPSLLTVIVSNGTSKLIKLDQTCLLYQMVYDEEDKILYGMNIQAESIITLFTIDMDTGKTGVIGTFPLHIGIKTKKNEDGCIELLGGATILDSDTKILYLYYTEGNGVYYQLIQITTATVVTHGDFDYDLASGVFGDTYEDIYALEIGDSPQYIKYFVSFDVKNSRITRQTEIPFWVYYDNESAYISDQKLYTTIMMTNFTSPMVTLVSINVDDGKVVYMPQYRTDNIIWGLKYANF